MGPSRRLGSLLHLRDLLPGPLAVPLAPAPDLGRLAGRRRTVGRGHPARGLADCRLPGDAPTVALKNNFSNDTVVTVAGALEEQAILTILEGLLKLFLSAAYAERAGPTAWRLSATRTTSLRPGRSCIRCGHSSAGGSPASSAGSVSAPARLLMSRSRPCNAAIHPGGEASRRTIRVSNYRRTRSSHVRGASTRRTSRMSSCRSLLSPLPAGLPA